MATSKPDLTRVWAEGAPPGNVVDPDITTPGKVASGWQAEVPPFEHFNFLQKWFTQGLAHFNEQGIAVWDTDTTYPISALAKGSDGNIYIAINEQSGNDPVSDNINWRPMDNQLLSIAQLKTRKGGYEGEQVFVRQYHTTLEGEGGGVFYWDSTSTESDNLGTIIEVTGVVTGRWKRRYEGSVDVKWFGAIGDGVTSDSAAFQAAVDTATTVRVSKCETYYLVGGLNVPAGTTFIGEREYVYTAFNVSDVIGKNAVVYDTSEPTFITWGTACNIIRCMFHGDDRSRDFLDTGSGGNIRMFQTSVFRCNFGFGQSTGTGNSRLLECHFSGNTTGIRSLIDSHVYMCEVNANEGDGITVASGNNDTVYMGNKVEWNNAKGYEFFDGNSSNIIIGGVVDRNGEAGLSVTSDTDLLVSSVKFRRNGRLSAANAEQDCHIALRGGSTDRLKLLNIQTATGDDDGGGGYLSPLRCITASNNASEVGSIIGCDLRGATEAAFNERSGGSLVVGTFTGNNVEGITLSTGGNPVFTNAASNVGFKTFSEREGLINPGNYSAPVNAVFNDLPPISTFDRAYYQLDVLTRNTSTGGTGMQRFMLAAQREGGSASEVLLEVASTASTSNKPTVTASFDTDAQTLTVNLDPGANSLNSRVVLSKAE